MTAKLSGMKLWGVMLLPACLALFPGHALGEPTVAKSSDKIWLANAAAALVEDEFWLRRAAINALLARAEASLGNDAMALGQEIARVSTRAEMFAFLESPLARKYRIALYVPDLRSPLLARLAMFGEDESTVWVARMVDDRDGNNARARAIANAILAPDLGRPIENDAAVPELLATYRARLLSVVKQNGEEAIKLLREKVKPSNEAPLPTTELAVHPISNRALVSLAALAENAGDATAARSAQELACLAVAFENLTTATNRYAKLATTSARQLLVSLGWSLRRMSSAACQNSPSEVRPTVTLMVARITKEVFAQPAISTSELTGILADILAVHDDIEKRFLSGAPSDARLAFGARFDEISQRLSGDGQHQLANTRDTEVERRPALKRCLAAAMAKPHGALSQTEFNLCIGEIKRFAEGDTGASVDTKVLNRPLASYVASSSSAFANLGKFDRLLTAEMKRVGLIADATELPLRDTPQWRFYAEALMLLREAFPQLARGRTSEIDSANRALLDLGSRHDMTTQQLRGATSPQLRATLGKLFDRYQQATGLLQLGLLQLREQADNEWWLEKNKSPTTPVGLSGHIATCKWEKAASIAIHVNVDAAKVFKALPPEFQVRVLGNWRHADSMTPADPFSGERVSLCLADMRTRLTKTPGGFGGVGGLGGVLATLNAEVSGTLVATYPYDYAGALGEKYDWRRHEIDLNRADSTTRDDTQRSPQAAMEAATRALLSRPEIAAAQRRAFVSVLRSTPLEHVVVEYRARQAKLLQSEPPFDVVVPGVLGTPQRVLPIAQLVTNVEESLALLRAYTIVSVPQIYREFDDVSLALYGDDSVALPNAEMVGKWAACAVRLKLAFDKQPFEKAALHYAFEASDAQGQLPNDARDCSKSVLTNMDRIDWGVAKSAPEYKKLAKNVDVWFSEPEVHKGSRGSSTPNFNHGTLLNTFDRVWETGMAWAALALSIEANENPLTVKLTLARLAGYP